MHDKQQGIHFAHRRYNQITVRPIRNNFDRLIESIDGFDMDIYSDISFLNGRFHSFRKEEEENEPVDDLLIDAREEFSSFGRCCRIKVLVLASSPMGITP